MLNYCLLVTGPAYGTQQASSAYQFAQALIAAGHNISCIFFYREGVHNANQLTSPASDEFDLVAAWQQLAKEQNIELHVCVAAALRRGIDESVNLAEHFTLSGLGELAKASLTADRVMQF